MRYLKNEYLILLTSQYYGHSVKLRAFQTYNSGGKCHIYPNIMAVHNSKSCQKVVIHYFGTNFILWATLLYTTIKQV